MNKVLTDFAVTHAKPKAAGYEISDGGQRGLRLAVQPSGAKSWVVRFRHPASGKSRKLTLPPGLSLAAARKLASDAMFAVASGIDPIDAKREQKQAAISASEGTLDAIAKQYLSIAASKLRSHDHYESVLARHILPRLGERSVTDLKRSEIVAVLDRVEIDAGASAADLALAVLRSMLRWYEKRADAFRSPIISGMARVKPNERARTRVLDDGEIRAVWHAAGDERIGAYGQVIRFMFLTGARKNEAGGLRRSEIETVRDNGDEIVVWRLPAKRSKNKQEIVRPLSPAALDIIESMPIIIGDSDFVFTLDGMRAMNMNYQNRRDLLDEIAKVQDWVVHDLRRVFRSLLSRCRVPFEIAERLLGHSQPVLVKTYDQHSHLAAMREAAEKVAAEIERIVAPEREGKVVRGRFSLR